MWPLYRELLQLRVSRTECVLCCVFRLNILSAVRRLCGTNCCPNRERERWLLASGWHRFTTCPGKKCTHTSTHTDSICTVHLVFLGKINLFPLYLPKTRHRAVNLFLQGYEKSWIEAEEHYFEDKLIEDLAVSSFQYKCKLINVNVLTPGRNFSTMRNGGP